MAELNFDAQAFQSQQLPDPLPQAPVQPAPPVHPQMPCVMQPVLTDGLTPEQQTYLGTESEWLGTLDTPAKVLEHLRLLAEFRAAQAAASTEHKPKVDPVERARITQARIAHANVVNNARTAWREAVAERDRVMSELNARVAELHAEFKRLKETKVQ